MDNQQIEANSPDSTEILQAIYNHLQLDPKAAAHYPPSMVHLAKLMGPYLSQQSSLKSAA